MIDLGPNPFANHARFTVKEPDGAEVSFSCAPEHYETALAEMRASRVRVSRGYSWPLREPGLRINVRWFLKQHPIVRYGALEAQAISRAMLRPLDRFVCWVKFRALDVYWFFKDRSAKQ